MPESFINLTEGSGKKAHTFQRVIGANTVEDEVWPLAELSPAAYLLTTPSAGVSMGTADTHLLAYQCPSNFFTYVRWIRVYQLAAATAAGTTVLELVRIRTITGAGGGSNIDAAKLDATDQQSGFFQGVAGGTTQKGLEYVVMDRVSAQFTQTIAAQSGGMLPQMIAEFRPTPRGPLMRLHPAESGLVVRNVAARAGATVLIEMSYSLANW